MKSGKESRKKSLYTDKKIDRLLAEWGSRERTSPEISIDVENSVMERIIAESKPLTEERQRKTGTGFILPFPLLPGVTAAAAAIVIILTVLLLYPGIGAVNNRAAGEERIEIRFVLDASSAETVEIAGDFTGWEPVAMEQDPNEDVWFITLELRRGETYMYNFILNESNWVVDPSRLTTVEDDFGSESTMLQL